MIGPLIVPDADFPSITYSLKISNILPISGISEDKPIDWNFLRNSRASLSLSSFDFIGFMDFIIKYCYLKGTGITLLDYFE